ncbi:MAG TPA: RodZ domain-containing protein [Verrucomicrobiae bacterium]|nr:RodZ domain-containing protein [Verrucomicrobiae bacterium]
MPALGERFRAAREARGLSLSDVSEQIRIRSVYLAAIEEQNWGTIGAPVYVRGFLRTYARFLGLDPEEVVAVFNGEIPAAAGMTAVPMAEAASPKARGAEPGGGRGLGALLWIAGLVAVALIAFVVYNEIAMRRESAVAALPSATPSAAPTPTPAASAAPAASVSPGAIAVAIPASPCPSPSPGAPASPCPSPSAVALLAAGPNSLALVLTATSWLRVTVDGSVSMEGTFPAGTSKTFHGKTALVRVGNAGGVTIYVDGKDVGKLGKSGDVVDRSFAL